MDALWNQLNSVLGLGVEPKNLTFLQISLRGIVVFVASLIIIRLGSKRALAQKTAFDAVLLIVLASVLARAINGSAAFFPTLGASLVIVLLHRIVAQLANRWHGLGILIKGEPHVILRDGQLDHSECRRNHISDHDFDEDMRLSAKTEDKGSLRIARIERSGDISFIKNEE
ncbi:MAG: DUF421 domain-containing protein [Chthoniobacterales bacterium]